MPISFNRGKRAESKRGEVIGWNVYFPGGEFSRGGQGGEAASWSWENWPFDRKRRVFRASLIWAILSRDDLIVDFHSRSNRSRPAHKVSSLPTNIRQPPNSINSITTIHKQNRKFRAERNFLIESTVAYSMSRWLANRRKLMQVAVCKFNDTLHCPASESDVSRVPGYRSIGNGPSSFGTSVKMWKEGRVVSDFPDRLSSGFEHALSTWYKRIIQQQKK